MAEWWEAYPVADESGGAATTEGGNWWEQYAPAEMPEAAPDYDAYYQELLARQDPTEQPHEAYARNLKLAADMDQANRGPITGSAPYRVAEDIASASASALIDPLLAIEGKLGIDAADEMRQQRQADSDISHMRDAGWTQRMVGGIGESIAQFGTLALAGGGLGSALGLTGKAANVAKWATVSGGIGQQAYQQSHRTAINEGKTEEEAGKIANATAALEVGVMGLFQKIGLGGAERALVSGLGANTARESVERASLQGIRNFLKQTAGELAEEEITTLTQTLAQAGDLGDWKAYRDTAVQTIGTMGLLSGSQKLINFAGNPSRRTAKEAGLDGVATTHKERVELAGKLNNRLTGQQFTEQLQAAATSPEEADALLEIYKARAASAGESFDDYVGKRLKGVEKTTREAAAALASGKTRPDGRRGEIEFLDEGPAIIRAFESQSVGTLLHETGHLFRRDLRGDDLKVAEQWAGARKGKWNTRAEEKFARGFERYLATGEAPTKKLANVFAKFKDWLTGIYGAIKGTAIDVNISPEMKGVFDRLLTPAQNNEGPGSETPISSPPPSGLNPEENTQSLQKTSGLVAAPDRTSEAPRVLSQDLADRFRGLANQTALPEARQANYEADVEMGFPERKTWADAEQRAAQRIQADPAGELARVVERINQANSTGGTINLENQEETALVNRLSDMLATDLANLESRALHRKLRFAFRAARSDQARALGYRDPLAVMDPEARKRKNITDAIAEPTPEEADARKKARTPEQHAEVDRSMEDRYNKAKEALAKQGIDLDDIDSIAADPKKAMVVMDHLRASGKFSDALFEFWRNSILSGTTTHTTNFISNASFGAWTLGPERAAEAAVNLFARNKNAATFGEFKYLLGGVLPGVMRGWRNARSSWSLETSALAEELGRDGAFKIDGPRGAIKGKLGRLVRAMGYRPLLAADEFAKSLVVTMEVGARAYRNGKSQGLEGQDLQEFIQQQTDDLGSASWSQSFAKAEELTFQGNRGLVAQKLAKGGHKLREFKGARWVLPFVETPAAIFEQGLKRAPVLGAILDYAESRRSGMNMVDAGMTPTLARQLIAMGGLAVLWGAVGGDDPWLTGADPISNSNRRDLSYRARPPMSIRIGDQWYSYARIEPFATAIATTADAVKGIQDGKYYKPATGLLQQAKEKSYLDGLGDAVDAVQGALEGDLSAAEQWGSKFAASWVPNAYRQTVRASEGEMDENRMWGKGQDRFERFLNRTGQQAGIPFLESQPRFDVWGNPISYNDMGDSPATSFMYRLASPVKSKDLSTVQQADLALVRWNEKHPDESEVYSEVPKYVTLNEQTQYLTDEQHAQYAEMAGQLAQAYVSGISFDPVNPTAQQIRQIKSAFAKARKEARQQLIPTWEFE